ncbi:MAG: hypothetical protein R3Y32_06725 [Bacillota bacterium]
MEYTTFEIVLNIVLMIGVWVICGISLWRCEKYCKKKKKEKEAEIAEFKSLIEKQNSLLLDICAQTQALVEKLAPGAIVKDMGIPYYNDCLGDGVGDINSICYGAIDAGTKEWKKRMNVYKEGK